MRSLLLAGSLFLLCCLGCTRNRGENGDVYVRINNTANLLLEDVQVGNTVVGTVGIGAMSGYVRMENTVYGPYCQFKSGTQSITAGYLVCGTPPPAPVSPGHYTFTVEPLNTDGFYPMTMVKD